MHTEELFLNSIREKLLKINLNENVDVRLKKLATAGLIDSDEYNKFMKLMKAIDDDKPMSPDMKKMIRSIFTKLISYLTKDKTIFNMLIKKLKEDTENFEKNKEKFFSDQQKAFERKYQIVEHNGSLHYVDEDDNLVPYNQEELLKFIKSKKSGGIYVTN